MKVSQKYLLLACLFIVGVTGMLWAYHRQNNWGFFRVGEDDSRRGVYGTYYWNVDWSGTPAEVDELEQEISHHSHYFERAQRGAPNQQFSIEWRGYLEVPATAEYTFFTNSDDGSWLWIDGALVVDNGWSHGVQEAQGKVYLRRGVLHSIRIRYVQFGGGYFLNIFWATGTQSKTQISADLLFPPDITVSSIGRIISNSFVGLIWFILFLALPNAFRVAIFSLVCSSSQKRSWCNSIVTLMIIFLLTILMIPSNFTNSQNYFSIDAAHSVRSMAMAINWRFCGKPSMLSPLGRLDVRNYISPNAYPDMGVEVAQRNVIPHPYPGLDSGTPSDRLIKFLFLNRAYLAQPVSSIPSMVEGTSKDYCATITTPFLNNENTLYYLFSAILWVNPNITMSSIGTLLIWFRIVLLLVLILALLRAGMSPAFCFLAFVSGVKLIAITGDIYGIYPFLLPGVACYAGVLSLALDIDFRKVKWMLAFTTFIIGCGGAFFFNLRSSYFPFIIIGYLLFIKVLWFKLKSSCEISPRSRLGLILLTMICLISGLFLVQLSLNKMLPETPYNTSYHVVFHPLVLSLGLPQNELASRERIQWYDGVGENLARKINSEVSYLGPGYEEALSTYYAQLWRKYPKEMIKLYLHKWQISTLGVIEFLSGKLNVLKEKNISQTIFHGLVLPLNVIISGIAVTIIFLCLIVIALLWVCKRSPEKGIILAVLSAAGFLISLESAVIYPFFTIRYHNALAYVFMLGALLFWQVVINGIVRGKLLLPGMWRYLWKKVANR